jgi:fucose permease
MAKPLRLDRLDYAGALGFFAYASSVVVTPIVLLALARDLDFGLAQGGGIEAVRAGFLMAILVASGFAAARWGKIPVLTAGSFVLGGGLILYAVAPLYAVVLLAMILVGLGSGLLEALINPLVQDVHPDDSGRYLNIVNAFFSIGVLASVLVVGELLTRGVSWRYLVAGVGALAIVSGILFAVLGRHEYKLERERRASRAGTARATFGHAREILRERPFWIFAVAIFCGGGAEGAFTFWSASYIQLNFDAVARAGALGTAAFAGGMVVGRLASGHYVRQNRLRALIIGSAVLGVVVSLFAYLVNDMIGLFALLFAAGLSIACFWPSIQSHAATVLKVDSTMLFILLSVAGIPGFGFTSWAMGLIAEATSLRLSLLVIPGLLAVLAAVMIFDRKKPGQEDQVQ